MSERDYELLGLVHELCVEVRKAMPEQEKKAENKSIRTES